MWVILRSIADGVTSDSGQLGGQGRRSPFESSGRLKGLAIGLMSEGLMQKLKTELTN